LESEEAGARAPVFFIKINKFKYIDMKNSVFEENSVAYDEWFKAYPYVFESEVEAVRAALPTGNIRGIEVGLGTGRFSEALGIKEGVEPIFEMRKFAYKRGIDVMDAVAERLPYKDLQFDFVLMVSCISYFHQLHPAFKEAQRVLKNNGVLIIGFIDKNSLIGKNYELKKKESTFYKQAKFYSVERVTDEIRNAGFKDLVYTQTLFEELDLVNKMEPAISGYGDGSFVVIRAIKK